MNITKGDHAYGNHPRQQLTIHHDADHPAGQNRPGLLLIHGGYWAIRSGVGYWPTKFAEAGYVVIETQYRLNGDTPWPAQLDDVRRALDFARGEAWRWNLDPERISALGSSAGGHLAARLAATGSALKAVVALSPPLSPYQGWIDGENPEGPWSQKMTRLRREAEKLAGCEPKNAAPGWETWVDMEVSEQVGTETPPMLLCYFGEDLVPSTHTQGTLEAISAAGADLGHISVVTASGNGHGMSLLGVPHVKGAVTAFLSGSVGLPAR